MGQIENIIISNLIKEKKNKNKNCKRPTLFKSLVVKFF